MFKSDVNVNVIRKHCKEFFYLQVPAMTSMENAWQQALSEDNDKLLKLHANLFERSDRVQSILDEMKATPVYQLFKNRLFALLLFSKAMSETGPRDFGNPNKEVNNNRSKSKGLHLFVPNVFFASQK